MITPAPLDARRPSTLGASHRPRRQTRRLVSALLGGLRFAAMALVGMLGVWLLVLLFGA